MEVINAYKDQFRIFSYDEDVTRSQLITELFRSQGYNFASFNDREFFLETIETQVPHIFILYYQPLNMKFREVLSKIRKQSAEVEVILLGSNDFWPGIRSLMQSGLVNDFWAWPVASKEVLKIRVDKIIEKTIYKYIAEQRSVETKQIVEKLEKLQQNTGFQKKEVESLDIFNLPTDAKTEPRLVEDLINNLKENHPKSDFVYIRHYQAKNQLLIARTSFCKETYFRGQSISMPKDLLATDRENGYAETRKLLEETFSTTEFCLQPVEFAGQLFGFIMAIHFSEKLEKYLQKAARYISLSLRNLQLESIEPTKAVESESGLELSSQKFFVELSKEISRSRRILKPISLIFTHIEFASDSEKEMKEVVKLIGENLRAYDFFCKVSANELIITLPHCDYESAAIKAERVRRLILSRGMRTQNTPLRLCSGVTEFPRLSPDSDQMLQDAESACRQVLVSGNNKVCLFTAPRGYEPEFTI